MITPGDKHEPRPDWVTGGVVTPPTVKMPQPQQKWEFGLVGNVLPGARASRESRL